MQAAASLAPITEPIAVDATLPEPVLMVDGIPHPTARLIEFTAQYPTDHREARIGVSSTPLAPGDPAVGLISPTPSLFPPINAAASAVLARPVVLTGGTQTWQVLAVGRLVSESSSSQPGQDDRTFSLRDRLAEAMSQLPTPEWQARLESATDLHGALREIAQAVNVAINPEAVANASLSQPLQANRSLAEIATILLRHHRLHFRLNRTIKAGRLTESITVLPDRFAPHHRTGKTSPGVLSWSSSSTELTPIVLAVQGRPRRIESTFPLQAGFGASLMSEPDASYSPETSPDWPTYAPVFRRWVLNEDHAEPDATPFDLAGFFEDPELAPTPLSFRDCLTLDTAGNRLPPLLETSFDGGLTYSLSSLGFQPDSDRGAITLTDPVLPSALLVAARSGQLHLRLTASLTSPRPTRLTRFRGNPFLNPISTTTQHADDLRFDTIHPDSIHAPRVANGQLQADIQDDRPLLQQRLIQALAESPASPPSGQATMTLAGNDLAHTPGDRLLRTGSIYRISRVRSRFDRAQTELSLAAI